MSKLITQQYNDAQFTAWAYINDVRYVKPRTGNPYYSLSLSILQGTKEAPVYLKVRSGNAHGEQAIGMAAALSDYLETAKKEKRSIKMFASIKLSDLTPSIYYVGDDPRISMMGRLYSITNVMVDDVKTFSDLDIIETSDTATSETETKVSPTEIEEDVLVEATAPVKFNPNWSTEIDITASQSMGL